MKSALVVPAFLVLLTPSARADLPVLGAGPFGTPNPLPPSRDTCWSEPPDTNGEIGSSEQLLAFGLESEIVNDFTVAGPVITKAIWGWAWYDEGGCGHHPPTPGFNLRFYEDAGCMPGAVIADLSITEFTDEFLGCVHDGDDLYRSSADVAVNMVPGQLYWFGMQVKDHEFPPQAGRLSTATVTGCESMFKSAYFSYPDWIPIHELWGFPWDASQEFQCGVTASRETSWGSVKTLFR